MFRKLWLSQTACLNDLASAKQETDFLIHEEARPVECSAQLVRVVKGLYAAWQISIGRPVAEQSGDQRQYVVEVQVEGFCHQVGTRFEELHDQESAFRLQDPAEFFQGCFLVDHVAQAE